MARFENTRLECCLEDLTLGTFEDPLFVLRSDQKLILGNAAQAGEAVLQFNFPVGSTYGWAGTEDVWPGSKGAELLLWQASGDTLWLFMHGFEPDTSRSFPLFPIRATLLGGPGWEGYVRIRAAFAGHETGHRVLAGTVDGQLDGGPRGVFAMDAATGAIRWWHETTNGGEMLAVDLDADGRLEIWCLQDSPCNAYSTDGRGDRVARVEVLDARTGELLPWGLTHGEPCFVSHMADVTDTDGDRRPDRLLLCILRRSGRDPDPDSLLAIAGGGGILRKRALSDKVQRVFFRDLDWDGSKEIVVSYHRSNLEVFDAMQPPAAHRKLLPSRLTLIALRAVPHASARASRAIPGGSGEAPGCPTQRKSDRGCTVAVRRRSLTETRMASSVPITSRGLRRGMSSILDGRRSVRRGAVLQLCDLGLR